MVLFIGYFYDKMKQKGKRRENMKSPIKIISAAMLCMIAIPSYATVYDLDVAMDNVRNACLGINSKMDNLKLMAGINTGIGAVGTLTGAGALAAGIVKSQKDEEIEALIRAALSSGPKQGKKETNEVLLALDKEWKKYQEEVRKSGTVKNSIVGQVDKLEQESKTLGNVRTGLLATNTVTSIAGAAIASQNRIKGSLKDQINRCISATEDLRESMMQARLDGRDTVDAKRIVDACSEYKFADLSKIDKLSTGATVTSSIGAVAGGIGTITSAVANTDSTRNDNSADGKAKEAGLNTASNVLSGVTTVTSATSTVLNGVQIATIKKVVSISENCEKEIQ